MAQHSIQLAQSPDLSPDGSRLAFVWQGDIWLVESNGGEAVRLTETGDNNSPKFSPDGKRVAFVSSRQPSGAQVYTMPVSGGEPTRLTHHTDGYGLLQWTPDGKQLLVSASRDFDWRRGGRMLLIDANERSSETLLFDSAGANGRLNRDGNQVIFTREGVAWWRKGYNGSQASQIWKYDLEADKFEMLNDHPNGARHPLWSPDGSSYYFVSGEDGAFNLYHKEIGSGTTKKLTRFSDDGVVMPTLSLDGSTLVFRQLFDFYRLDLTVANSEPQLIKIVTNADLARTSHQNVTLSSATDAAFSSDGLEVAMIAGGDLWVMDTILREPKQITITPEEESSPVFSIDGNSLFFVSDSGGQSDIWVATRKDESKYWWLNDEFELKKLTQDSVVESKIKVSPDGERLAYIRQGSGIWIMNVDGSNVTHFLETWDSPDFDWSPDGKWLTWASSDNDFNRDIFVGPIDHSLEPVNLSRHPRNDRQPVWSPDGKMIAFTGTRDSNETDIHIVVLQREQIESTSRDRKLEEALKKFESAKRPKPSEEKKKENTSSSDEKEAEQAATASDKKEVAKKTETGKSLPDVRIDFDEIHSRVIRVSISDSSESGLMWSPDSKTLAFNATVDGKRGLYKIEPPFNLSPKSMMSQTVSGATWIANGKQILSLSGGVPQSLTESGQATRYTFNAYSTVDLPARYEAGFDQAWRAMRDNFYDENLNNRNWDAIRRKYRQAARDAVDMSSFSAVVQMMLGELNGSHLGFSARSGGGRSRGDADNQWNETTAHFGLRYDLTHRGPGLLVRDVIYRSPAWQQRSRVEVGETVLAIDGVEVDPGMDLTTVLNGRSGREVTLRVKNQAGEERLVSILPISFNAARGLLYDHWQRQNQQLVEQQSENSLGYVHIRGMNMNSFYEFERDLFAIASGKDGLIIDVRDNGGGSTADHLLTVLTQPRHAITVPRDGGPGYPHDRIVYATWDKPIIVMCNQNSFSNAEIFSHAIKTLKRGRLVGVPTAGGVISTGSVQIMDLGTLRRPFRGWFSVADGEDMELNGAVPDVVIWPQPADQAQGIDQQLNTAIEMLKEDVTAWQQRPQPKLKKASQR